MTMERILSQLRKAVDDYQMIDDGDLIAVGCSGGKDSTLLLAALKQMACFYPKHFDVVGIAIDIGAGMDYSPLVDFCNEKDIRLEIEHTRIYDIVFTSRQEQNPCSLCSNMRRGALNRAAAKYGANKVALGHHNDDVLDTFMLNLVHAGKIGTFKPVTYLTRSDMTIIRPFIYIQEKDIKNVTSSMNIPVLVNPCPEDKHTERETMKNLVSDMDHEYKGFKKRLFGAIQRSGIDGWQEFPSGRHSEPKKTNTEE